MPAKDIPIHSDHMAQIMDTTGIPLRKDTLFTNHKGVEKSSFRKNAETALEKLRDILKKTLEPDEAVIYVMPAQSPVGSLQQVTMGWMIYNVTRTMLVVTNRRLLAFHVKPKSWHKWDWARRVRSIRFGDFADAKVKGFLSHSLELRYSDGRKEKYWGIRGGDAKKLKLILDAVMPGCAGEATAARGPVCHCPNCAAALEPKQESCRACGQLFATEKEMWKRSIIFPGGGYFYAGQTALGVLDSFAEIILTGALAVFLLIAAGVPDFISGDLEPYTTQGEAAVGVIIIGVILALEKLITGFHGRHLVQDFYPLSKPPSTAKWLILGGGVYLMTAAFIFLLISASPDPIAQIGPDIQIYRADFGIFTDGREGDIFTSEASIPATPGLRYGILVRFRTPRAGVKLKTQFEIPGMAIPEGAELPEGLRPHEETVPGEGGIIARFWGVLADEPLGEQKLNVFLEDKLVRSFTFSVGRRSKPPA